MVSGIQIYALLEQQEFQTHPCHLEQQLSSLNPRFSLMKAGVAIAANRILSSATDFHSVQPRQLRC